MILVCGEALVDLLPGAESDEEEVLLPLRAVAGGSPFNLARGLARLGCPAGFLGGLSRDRFGRRLAATLARDGVAVDLAPRSDRPTALALAETRPDGGVSYSFHATGTADRAVTLNDLPARLPTSVEALTFGSCSLARDPAGASYLALAEREAGQRTISLDPNLRPALTPDLAAWHARFSRFLATADIVKASEEDIALAYGTDRGLAEVAAGWRAAGAGLVVITLGHRGALAFHDSLGSAGIEVPGQAVTLADTVGAGDAFHAALLARLRAEGALVRAQLPALGRDALGDALDYAVSASALACTRPGAQPPLAAEVARFHLEAKAGT